MEGYQIQNVLETLIITMGSLTGLWLVTRVFIAKRLRGGGPDAAQLTGSVDRLRESIEGMREELGDVTERLDFNERVLARMAEEAKSKRQLPPS
jgi:hypothetical protein